MEIVDAQIHDPLPVQGFGPGLTAELAGIIGAELALSAMSAAGVDAAVVHHREPLSLATLEDSYIPAVEAPRRYPGKFGGVVTPSATAVTDINEFISQVRSRFGLLAIRMIPSWPLGGPNDIPRLREGGFDDWFRAAEKHQVPICLFIPGHLPEVVPIATAFPELTLIIDHFGMPPPPHVPVDRHLLDALPELVALAQFPNVAVKCTGVTALSVESYPFADLWPRLHTVLDAFGADRLMWGSDFTRTSVFHSYSDALTFLTRSNELSASDIETMCSTTIRRLLRWPKAEVES
jgi:L-fuconolactonase